MVSVIAAIACINISSHYPTSQPALPSMKVEIPGTVISFEMVRIPAGKLGDASIGSIWVARHEVTWDVFDIYAFRLDLSAQQNADGVDAESRPSRPYGAPDRGFGHKGYAALGMTSNSAETFCEWLSKKTGRKFRLPTEAEWEYAARAGAASVPEKLGDVAWYWDNADDKAHPVGKKEPNAWGLYDMLGNVWEWTVGREGKPVVRGGSYMSKASEVTFDARKPFDPKWQEADAHVPKSKWWLSDGPFIGMRVVCDP